MMRENIDVHYPWGNTRRFYAYSDYFRQIFGERIQKVTINAGFTCPNRDGNKASGGCTYCNNAAFNPSYCTPQKSITQQIDEGVQFHKTRYRSANKYLAYFQAYSNTYAPLSQLKKIYDEALRYPDVVGLVIGTRPDCIDQAKLDYFAARSLEVSPSFFLSLYLALFTLFCVIFNNWPISFELKFNLIRAQSFNSFAEISGHVFFKD